MKVPFLFLFPFFLFFFADEMYSCPVNEDFSSVKEDPIFTECKRKVYEEDVPSLEEIARRPELVALTDSFGWNLLFYTVFYRRPLSLKALLASGSFDLGETDMEGNSILHAAVLNNCFVDEIVACEECDVNQANLEGYTPLLLAAVFNRSEAMETLLRHPDVDVYCEDERGQALADTILVQNRENLFNRLVAERRLDVNQRNARGDALIHRLIDLGETEALETLLQCPALNPNLKDGQGEEPLFRAVKTGQGVAVRLILCREDVRLEIKDSRNRDLLQLSSELLHDHCYQIIYQVVIERAVVLNDCRKRKIDDMDDDTD